MHSTDPRRRLLRAGLACILATLLAGCASDPRFGAGPGWVEEQAAERRRLEAMGFPQFTGPN